MSKETEERKTKMNSIESILALLSAVVISYFSVGFIGEDNLKFVILYIAWIYFLYTISLVKDLRKNQILNILDSPLSTPEVPLNEEGTKQRIREELEKI